MHAPARAGQPAGGANDPDRAPEPEPREERGQIRDLGWALMGDDGLRAGWSIAIFILLFRLFAMILGNTVVALYPPLARFDFSPVWALGSEVVPFLAMLGAAALVGLVEHRRIVDFNLTGPQRRLNFFCGVAAGLLGLSALVGGLDWGGWLHFGPVALSGAAVAKYAVLWGGAFLLVGCVEEGIFRCFLQFNLTRGLNFWWALGTVSVVCIDVLLRSRGQMSILSFLWIEPLGRITGNGYWGVLAVALAGLFPCFLLHRRNAARSGFWQAAWVTSTLFGFVHTGNNGENWIGIFAAAAIGFVFCVSVWVTGSAWWAIGCHAAWDWAETYFYGTADSGFVSKGHFLTTSLGGNTLWSGGTDGPEGSLLVLATILLLLVALLAIYGRRRAGDGGTKELAA
jgi:membrane protease YdiL (CAAX protease family)